MSGDVYKLVGPQGVILTTPSYAAAQQAGRAVLALGGRVELARDYAWQPYPGVFSPYDPNKTSFPVAAIVNGTRIAWGYATSRAAAAAIANALIARRLVYKGVRLSEGHFSAAMGALL